MPPVPGMETKPESPGFKHDLSVTSINFSASCSFEYCAISNIITIQVAAVSYMGAAMTILKILSHQIRRRMTPYGTVSGDAWRRTVPCGAVPCRIRCERSLTVFDVMFTALGILFHAAICRNTP